MNEIKRRPGARRPGTPDETVQRITTADGRMERPSAQRPSVQARPRPQSHISEQQSSAVIHTERNENTPVTERRRASRPMPSSFRTPQPEREAVHPRPQRISRTVPAPAVREQPRPEPQKKEYPENVPPSFKPFGRADIEAILKQESSHHTVVKTPERKTVPEQEHLETEVNKVRHTETVSPSVTEQTVQSQTEENRQTVLQTPPVIERDVRDPLQSTRLIHVFAERTAEQMKEQQKDEPPVSEGGHAIILPLEEEKKKEDVSGEDLYAQFASEAPATMTGSMPAVSQPSEDTASAGEQTPPEAEKDASDESGSPEKNRWNFGRKKKDDGKTEEKKPEPGSKKKGFLKWLLVFVMILGMFVGLKKTGVLAAESVIGTSMEPNYHTRDIVYSTNIRDIKRYDVVVADSPTGIKVIKRVIGLPGDTVTYKNRHVYVNGTLTDESFISGGAEIELNLSGKIELGDDEYFVCGDNRENSSDSRIYGAITRSDIFGIVLVRIPLSGQF